MILNLELAPGNIVSKGQLAKELGFGRTPVREALLVLAQEHLITAVPGIGSEVVELSIPDIAFISEFQGVIEPFTARLAAQRISDSTIGELRSIVREAKALPEEGNLTRIIELDLRFHHTMAEFTGNPYLVESMMKVLHLAVRIARYACNRGVTTNESWEERQGLLDALATHAPDAAEVLRREHVQGA